MAQGTGVYRRKGAVTAATLGAKSGWKLVSKGFRRALTRELHGSETAEVLAAARQHWARGTPGGGAG